MDYFSDILIMAVLVLMSAYFSATETAFSSLNKTRLKAMAEKGNKRAELTYKISEQYDKLISTILVGNNIVNIALASYGTLFFVNKLDLEQGATISTLVITVIVLIFGEISPKSIAKDSPEKFAMFSAPFIRILIKLLTPINFIFTKWKRILSKIVKTDDDTKMSQEELLMIVEEVQQEGSLDDDESVLIRNAIEFTEQRAEDILTHRVDVEAIDVDSTREEVEEIFSNTRFSRLLVYKESIDNVIGIIHYKDFMTAKDKNITEIMTKPLFIQQTESINDLLKILQKKKSHMAVVIDEYGGTLGIVTMEDILEELVGEIWDEHDEVVENFREVGENTYLVDGSVNFDDFCEFMDIEAETESISVGGWVTEKLEKIPEKGDKFVYEDWKIMVIKTEKHRVTQIKISK